MQTLNASLRTRGEAGQALPGMIKELSDVGAELRYGELSMLFAAPGVGKSVLAMAIALQCGVPVYYFSTDTSRFDMGSWCAAHASGDMVNSVKRTLEVEPSFYDSRVQELNPNIMWDWDTSPDFTRIEEELEAFVVAFGDYPHLIVVDNLRNVYSTEEEVRAQQHNAQRLKDLAAATQSAVLVLHHAVGSHANGDVTPTLRDLESKVDKFEALIVSLSRGKPELGGDLRCAILKNRGGPANASGKLKVFVSINTSTMQVGRQRREAVHA